MLRNPFKREKADDVPEQRQKVQPETVEIPADKPGTQASRQTDPSGDAEAEKRNWFGSSQGGTVENTQSSYWSNWQPSAER